MNRIWSGPDREPTEPTEAAPVTVGPRATVPRPPHARLRTAAIEIFGLDAGCSDDAIILAMLEYAPR